MPRQLTLFRPRTDASFANFVVAEANAVTVHALRDWLEQGGGGIFCLFGAADSGRSHLLQAACRERVAIYLPLSELIHHEAAAVCEGLEQAALVCLDDIDAVLGDPVWCEQLFHLCNRLLGQQHKLLFSARGAAASLPCTLPDLLSRLGWGGSFRLQPLDDQGAAEALKIRARERGFDLDDDVVAYILGRSQRGMQALLSLLHALDVHSLAEHKRITIPFVRRFLGQANDSGEELWRMR